MPESIVRLLTDMMQHDPQARISDYATLIARIDEQTIAPEIPDTVEWNDPSWKPSQTSRRLWKKTLAASMAIFALVGIAWATATWTSPATQAPPGLIETVYSQPLFNGQNLAGWTNHASVWSVQSDEEGSRVLAGNGYLSHPIPVLPPDVVKESVGVGVRVRVELNQADAIEVQFAFEDSSDPKTSHETGGRHVVRFTGTDALLGYRESRDAVLEVAQTITLPSINSPSDAPMWHEVYLQRIDDRWFARFDDKPLGSVPASDSMTDAMIQLCAERGQAFFGDISVFGLQRVSP